MNKLLLIDGHNFLFRSYSVPFKFFSAKNTPLHVVTTFLKLIRRSLDAIDGNDTFYIAIAFDTQTVTSNHLLLEGYKANRPKDFDQMEDNPFKHLPLIQKVLHYLEIPYFEIPGVEADDVIATLANNFLEEYEDGEVYIASHDTDFYQLLSRNVKIIKHLAKDETIIVDRDFVHANLGVFPEQYVFFKSLTGDQADNIKGVPGIGKIRAKKIVNQEMDFDIDKYIKILGLNEQLIGLNNLVDLDAKPGILKETIEKSNREIFKECEF